MIEAEGIVKRHGSLEILRGVSLAFAGGEVAAIVGRSGAGKSTFLRCLNGLESFQGGSVTVDGLRVDAKTPPGQRSKILRRVCLKVGMVFQSFNLFPHRTILQNVTEGPICILGLDRASAEERAKRLLDRVGLLNLLDARPAQLSGGEQQRVAIARALAMEPRAILFDEPCAALDPIMTEEVLAVMTDLAKDGLTMIVVTHDMKFARQVAQVVHVFDKGQVVESGTPDQVFEQPRHESTKLLLAGVQTDPARPRAEGIRNPAGSR